MLRVVKKKFKRGPLRNISDNKVVSLDIKKKREMKAIFALFFFRKGYSYLSRSQEIALGILVWLNLFVVVMGIVEIIINIIRI